MWLCTKYGFFSVKQDKHDRYFIRARVRQDLVNLCEKMQAALVVDPGNPVRVLMTQELPGSVPVDVSAAIQDWPTADYRFRLIVSRQALGAIFTLLADSIDYPNFKSEVSKHPDQQRHLALYHEVWGTMRRL
jgi:hypothetical protein